MKYAIVSGKAASGKTRTLRAYAEMRELPIQVYRKGMAPQTIDGKAIIDEVPEECVRGLITTFKGSELLLAVQNGDKLHITGNDKTFVDKVSKYVP